MHCVNLCTLFRQGPKQRTWKRAVIVTGFVLTLGATVSWGQVPATNDTSDNFGNTGGGTNALVSLTAGSDNTAYGTAALVTNSEGSFNTAFGFDALSSNTGGNNTAVGFDALSSNTTGGDNTAVGLNALSSTTTANLNTAVGSGALTNTTSGGSNTAVGFNALSGNTTGDNNLAVGDGALSGNTTGTDNTALGSSALSDNSTGLDNTALGSGALINTSSGGNNTAVGFGALSGNTTGNFNTALGLNALFSNTSGGNNIAIGRDAGRKLTGGNQNIYLGHAGPGGAHTESQTLRLGQKQTRAFIAGIYGVAVGNGSPQPVYINSQGQLGTSTQVIVSSARYKRDIEALGARSQDLYKLRPVTFRYKQDEQGVRQYGLIAEEVLKVYPELVTKGAEGKVEGVQYQELIPLLLNEVQHQQQTLATQAQELAALKAQNERLQAALVQQNAAVTARLDHLEHEPHSGAVAAR